MRLCAWPRSWAALFRPVGSVTDNLPGKHAPAWPIDASLPCRYPYCNAIALFRTARAAVSGAASHIRTCPTFHELDAGHHVTCVRSFLSGRALGWTLVGGKETDTPRHWHFFDAFSRNPSRHERTRCDGAPRSPR